MKKSSLLFIPVMLLLGCTKHFIKPSVICMDNQNFIQSSITHPKGDALQNILDSYIAEGIPGVTLLIADNNGIWTGSAGHADLQNNIKMQPCHILKPGSVTKMIIGNLIWQFQEEGILNIKGKDGPAIIHGVQHIFHPVEWLE